MYGDMLLSIVSMQLYSESTNGGRDKQMCTCQLSGLLVSDRVGGRRAVQCGSGVEESASYSMILNRPQSVYER